MVLVRAFSIPGLQCRFYSSDHEPPHFHAKRKGEWEVRVYFQNLGQAMIEVMWNRKPISSRFRDRLISAVEEHREALVVEWERVHENDP